MRKGTNLLGCEVLRNITSGGWICSGREAPRSGIDSRSMVLHVIWQIGTLEGGVSQTSFNRLHTMLTFQNQMLMFRGGGVSTRANQY